MKNYEILETVAIFLAILSLWPRILGWPHIAWKVFMYVMLAAMVWVFVRRVCRYRQMVREQRDQMDRRDSP